MRIQLNCDHKWRDWASLTSLKYILEKCYKHEVFLVSRNDRDVATNLFNPHCVVIPHVNGKAQLDYVKNLKSQKRRVVVLPTEGRPIYKELLPYFYGEYTDYNDIDLFLSWNDTVKNGIISRNKISREKISTVGCIRFDYYFPPYKKIFLDKNDFCKKYRLDYKKPIVTWATQYNYARFFINQSEWGIKDLKYTGVADCFARSGYDVVNFPKDQYEERKMAAEAFFFVAKKKPQVNFIIKPHPAEDADFYENLIRKNRVCNVHFIHHEQIWNILNNTNVHLQRHCTTAIEAWMLDKPTIEMEIGSNHPFYWQEIASGSNSAQTKEELLNYIEYYLDDCCKISPDILVHREDYIKHWFYRVDGKRTSVAAQKIDELFSEKGIFIPWQLKQKLNYKISTSLLLNWRKFSIDKPLKIQREIKFDKNNTDKINIMDRYITQYDVKQFTHKLKNIMRWKQSKEKRHKFENHKKNYQ